MVDYQNLDREELIELHKKKDRIISQSKFNGELEGNLMKIIKSAPIRICLTDDKGYFEFVNSTYCDIYGYSEDELIGRKFTEVVTDSRKEKLARLHDDFIENGSEIRGEWFVEDKKGLQLTILADAARLRTGDGNYKKLTYVVDITEKKELEEDLRKSRDHLNSIISTNPDILTLFDEQGNFLDLWTGCSANTPVNHRPGFLTL